MYATTQPAILDIPAFSSDACSWTGYLASIWGPEDPRLFWTVSSVQKSNARAETLSLLKDAGTPGLFFGQMASDMIMCRSINFVADLRRIFPPLIDATYVGEGVSPYNAHHPIGEIVNRELQRATQQGGM